jgi:hypothetical protein
MNMKPEDRLNTVKRKLITSLLINNYELLGLVFARVYTSELNTKTWLYSGLEGGLALVIDYHRRTGRFLLFDLDTFEIIFENELYKKFNIFYSETSATFQCFEIPNGFIGFSIPDVVESKVFYRTVCNLTDVVIMKRLKEHRITSIGDVKTAFRKNISVWKKKLAAEYFFKEVKMESDVISFEYPGLNKVLNMIEYEDDSKTFLVNGNCEEINELLSKVSGINRAEKGGLRVNDIRAYAFELYKNIKTSVIKEKECEEKIEAITRSVIKKEEAKVVKIKTNENKTAIYKVSPTNKETKITSIPIPDIPKQNMQIVTNVLKVTNIPNVPNVTNVSNVPNVPKVTNIPNIPNVPKISNVPKVPNIPIIPNIPKFSNIPNAPNITVVPNVPDIAVLKVQAVPVIPIKSQDQIEPLITISPITQLKTIDENKSQGKPIDLMEEIRLKAANKNFLKKVPNITTFINSDNITLNTIPAQKPPGDSKPPEVIQKRDPTKLDMMTELKMKFENKANLAKKNLENSKVNPQAKIVIANSFEPVNKNDLTNETQKEVPVLVNKKDNIKEEKYEVDEVEELVKKLEEKQESKTEVKQDSSKAKTISNEQKEKVTSISDEQKEEVTNALFGNITKVPEGDNQMSKILHNMEKPLFNQVINQLNNRNANQTEKSTETKDNITPTINILTKLSIPQTTSTLPTATQAIPSVPSTKYSKIPAVPSLTQGIPSITTVAKDIPQVPKVPIIPKIATQEAEVIQTLHQRPQDPQPQINEKV